MLTIVKHISIHIIYIVLYFQKYIATWLQGKVSTYKYCWKTPKWFYCVEDSPIMYHVNMLRWAVFINYVLINVFWYLKTVYRSSRVIHISQFLDILWKWLLLRDPFAFISVVLNSFQLLPSYQPRHLQRPRRVSRSHLPFQMDSILYNYSWSWRLKNCINKQNVIDYWLDESLPVNDC